MPLNRQKTLLALLIGCVLGVVWLVAIRFFTYESNTTHYHANFALYINGEQDKFDNFTFYEEVQSCGSDEVNNPRTRVHLHGQVGSVAHVHDPASTWGHLFANLGYVLGNDLVQNDDGVYRDGQDGNKLSFWLNGSEVDGVANLTIHSEDTLLISYGQEDDTMLRERYDAITKDAGAYNQRNDQTACSGGNTATFTEKLKQSFGF